MTILYLHGLKSKLSTEKRTSLSNFGNVIAPDIPYSDDPNIINTLYKTYKDQKIDVIIGSSMGGFAGFYISQLLDIPALLFNPALAKRSITQNIPDYFKIGNKSISILIGEDDTTVLPSDTVAFLNNQDKNDNLKIEIVPALGHRIPQDFFAQRTTAYLKHL